ncbi:MAG TPA: YihY/virulence factor BrkB family protein [Candidatus Angelobacter sp.]|nr:YihY/virulence factor BrkB family protein [Candidatus Angelobacter sp.]
MPVDTVSPPAEPTRKGLRGFLTSFMNAWQQMLRRRGVSTLHYLTKPEAHTFAFSVAANAILSFFPFMVLMLWLIRHVFHSQNMEDVVVLLLRDHLPAGQDFVIRNISSLVASRQGVKLASVLILLITSTGVFLPLEVALNHIWGFTKSRSYLGNQLVSLALAFACGMLAMASVGAATGNLSIIQLMLLGHHDNLVFKAATWVALKIFATAASIAIFFLIYWILPHGKVRPRSVLPAAVAMGILWEVSKYIYIKALPWLDFREVYGPFAISVTLMFWAFLSGLMLLAGAHLASEFAPQAPSSSL